MFFILEKMEGFQCKKGSKQGRDIHNAPSYTVRPYPGNFGKFCCFHCQEVGSINQTLEYHYNNWKSNCMMLWNITVTPIPLQLCT